MRDYKISEIDLLQEIAHFRFWKYRDCAQGGEEDEFVKDHVIMWMAGNVDPVEAHNEMLKEQAAHWEECAAERIRERINEERAWEEIRQAHIERQKEKECTSRSTGLLKRVRVIIGC